MTGNPGASEQHPLQAYWDLTGAAVQAQAISVALEMEILELLAQPVTAKVVAETLALDTPNTAFLLDLLWSMKLLDKVLPSAATNVDETPFEYQLGPVGRRYFLRSSDRYAGAAWLSRQTRLQDSAAMLERQVRGHDSVPDPTTIADGWSEAAGRQLVQDQLSATVPAALKVMDRVARLRMAENLLDLGGGPGHVAIAFAQQYKSIRATVFDFPGAIAFADKNIERAGLCDRISTRSGDLSVTDIGSEYDVIWCSSVMHFVPDIDAVLRKIYRALNSDGVLVCVHAEQSTQRDQAARVLPFYLPMLMT